jgi:hypothetical protein
VGEPPAQQPSETLAAVPDVVPPALANLVAVAARYSRGKWNWYRVRDGLVGWVWIPGSGPKVGVMGCAFADPVAGWLVRTCELVWVLGVE